MHGTVFGIMKRDEWERRGNLISEQDLYRPDLMDYVKELKLIPDKVVLYFSDLNMYEWVDESQLIFKINKKERANYLSWLLKKYKKELNKITSKELINNGWKLLSFKSRIGGRFESTQLFEYREEQPFSESDWLASKDEEELECEYVITIVADYHY